ncbi:MAG: hypothetical protein WAR37_01805 [Candidatus Microsaccharimonas sp.]
MTPEDSNKQFEDQPLIPQPSIANETPQPAPLTPNSPTVPEPIVTPTAPTQQPLATPPAKPQPSSAGVIILEWLSYAFWGWLIIGIIWLLSVILTNAIVGTAVNDVVPYAIAASVVLLPLAFITDLFYRKREPARKVGAAMVIMVIHAVIFALLAISALIVSVFTGINFVINSVDPGDITAVVILVSVAAFILYAAAFLRTLNPFKKIKGSLIYAISMLTITVLLLVFAVVGPVMTTLATRKDRQIEAALPTVSYAIQNYVSENDALPTNLSDITPRSDSAEKVIKDGWIEYKPEGMQVSFNENLTSYYRYQLCVNYDRESKESGGYYSYNDNSGYTTSLDAAPHSAGKVCYKVRTY